MGIVVCETAGGPCRRIPVISHPADNLHALRILMPRPDAVVNIRLRAEPEVGPTHRLLTYLDGKLLPGENATEHSLTNVERGVHSVTSVILNRDGRELIRSAPLVFHMKQTTVNNPRNQGPTLRPPQPVPLPRPATPRGG